MSSVAPPHCPTCGKAVSPLAAHCPFDGTEMDPEGLGYTLVKPQLLGESDGRTDPALSLRERAVTTHLGMSADERTESFNALALPQGRTQLTSGGSLDRTVPMPFAWEEPNVSAEKTEPVSPQERADRQGPVTVEPERTQQLSVWPGNASPSTVRAKATEPSVPSPSPWRRTSSPNLPAVIVDSALYSDRPPEPRGAPSRRSLRTLAIVSALGAAAMLLIAFVALGFRKEKTLKPIGPSSGRSRVVRDLAVMATPSQRVLGPEGMVDVQRTFEARINALDRKRRASGAPNPHADELVQRLRVDLRTLSTEGVPAFSKRMDQFEHQFVSDL